MKIITINKKVYFISDEDYKALEIVGNQVHCEASTRDLNTIIEYIEDHYEKKFVIDQQFSKQIKTEFKK